MLTLVPEILQNPNDVLSRDVDDALDLFLIIEREVPQPSFLLFGDLPAFFLDFVYDFSDVAQVTVSARNNVGTVHEVHGGLPDLQ